MSFYTYCKKYHDDCSQNRLCPNKCQYCAGYIKASSEAAEIQFENKTK